jgi:iron complex outermembrane receptor protein
MKISGCIAVLVASTSTLVMAQTAPAPSATPPVGPAPVAVAEAAPDQGGIADVVVTARKRSESSQNVPVAITAFSGKQLDNQNITSLEKLSQFTPQLTIARSATGSGAQITLRGVGSNPGSLGIEQSVAVIVDGVYYGQGRIINEGLFDLSNMEILKGPQSLFYGKNATAGVISITTAGPTSTFTGRVKAGYEFGSRQPYGEAMLSGPLTENLGFRVAVYGSDQLGGYFKNNAGTTSYTIRDVATGALNAVTAAPAARNTPQEKNIIARGTLQWKPLDRLTATLKVSGNINNTNNPAWNGVIANCANGTSFLNKVTPCARDFVINNNNFPVVMASSFPLAGKNGELYNKYSSWSTTGTLDYAGENVNINGVVNINRNVNKLAVDSDNQSYGPSNVYATEHTTFRAYSGELRALTTFNSPINVLLGGYYQNSKRTFEQYAQTGNISNSAAFDPKYNYVAFAKNSATDGETLSAYGQAIWKIVPRVEATAGVRYIHETKSSFFIQPYINPALQARFIQGRLLTADQTFQNWSPEATITWRPTNDLTAYLDYKTAYKSGGFSNSALDTALGNGAADMTFAPEKSKGFEGGLKSTLFDHQVRLNIGAYSYKYTNFQIDFQNSQTFAFITTNAGSVRAKGIELEGQFSPRAVPGLNMRGSINYSHARYISFLAPCYSGETIVQGCNTTFRGSLGQRLDGKPTTNAPTWTGAAGVDYEVRMNSGASLLFTVDGRYTSGYFASAFNSPLSAQPGYALFDASIRWTAKGDRFGIALIGKNLTNRFVVTGAADAPSTGSGTGTTAGVIADQRSYTSLPRTVQVEATYKF